MNIFKEEKFYPTEEATIKEHFSGTFDSVFLSFIPFFKIDESHLTKTSFQRLHQITYPQFKSANPDLNLPETISGEVYSNDNPDYPTNDEILKFGSPVKWSEILSGVGFDSFAELNQALTTAIGGYREEFARQDLADRLLQFAENSHTFLPEEGAFDVFSKLSILRTFRRLGKGFIVVRDEFLEKKSTLDIREISDDEFCKQLGYKDYYICDIEEEVLFAIDWDDFFFLIAASTEMIDRILADGAFEGFLCEDSTRTYWELGDKLLEK